MLSYNDFKLSLKKYFPKRYVFEIMNVYCSISAEKNDILYTIYANTMYCNHYPWETFLKK